MVFTTARWEGKEGLIQNTEWEEIFLAFTRKLFNSDVLLTLSAAQQGQETHIHCLRKNVCVLAALPKGSQRMWPCLSGDAELFQEETASGCSPEAANASVHDSAFVFSSPPFTPSPSLSLLAAPAKGKSGFILPSASVYAAMATLCFTAETYREKITSGSLAVQSRGHWSLMHSALRLA